MDEQDEIVELGTASLETKGRTSGIWTESSVVPWRICNPPGTPSCPGT